jgi:hypothetical protein
MRPRGCCASSLRNLGLNLVILLEGEAMAVLADEVIRQAEQKCGSFHVAWLEGFLISARSSARRERANSDV